MGKKVFVVGAGMAGLSSAIRLQHAGYEVEIYEQGSKPGGKMHQIKAEGFTFDVGPTLVMMPSIYREVFTLAGRNPDDYIPMKRLDPMYEVYFKDEPYRHYEVSSDLTKLMEMVEKKGPENARGFLQYLSEIYTRYQVALDHFITRPFRNKKDIYNPFMMQQALKLKTFDSADHMMASFMPDKDLQQMLSFQTLYIGVSPQKGPSLYNIIPMIELLYGVWFIEGGMHTMAEGMARLFEELGGKIHYNHKVDEILIAGGKALGLAVKGKAVKSDYVISNADFPYTMTHLIKENSARGKYTKKISTAWTIPAPAWSFTGAWIKPTKNSHRTPLSFLKIWMTTSQESLTEGSLRILPSIFMCPPRWTLPWHQKANPVSIR